jgi:hypothetical protein
MTHRRVEVSEPDLARADGDHSHHPGSSTLLSVSRSMPSCQEGTHGGASLASEDDETIAHLDRGGTHTKQLALFRRYACLKLRRT